MIKFREKLYSEYDAMRQLYVEMSKRYNSYDGKIGFKVISPSYLSGILKGNSVVIEKFVIVSRMIGSDKYRMYIKLGSKIKLPDKIKLPSLDSNYTNIGSMKGALGGSLPRNNYQNTSNKQNDSESEDSDDRINSSSYDRDRRQRRFSSNSSSSSNSGGSGYGFKIESSRSLGFTSKKPLGSTILYDKNSRSLVLEFNSIRDAVESLNYLPLGLSYDLYIVS